MYQCIKHKYILNINEVVIINNFCAYKYHKNYVYRNLYL